MTLWEALRRSNDAPLPDAEIDALIARTRPLYAPYGEEQAEEFAADARLNLRERVRTTRIFYYDRSSNGSDEEFHTFHDEWCLGDYNDEQRNNHNIWEVKITPSPSYIDYALYWYGKSFDIAGNSGIYVDNNFFVCDYNRAMTAAYRKEDGAIMPSTGIWGLRELAKRSFVYLNERGMKPINMSHLTTTNILPISAFYTVTYDWELKFSEGDVQSRFTREYLQLISNGDHAGAWPIVLHEQGNMVADPWTLKTFLAVAVLHELLIDPYIWHHRPIPAGDTAENRLFATFRRPLLDLCQQPDVEVFRYWDQRPQPITADHPNIFTIVYLRPGHEAIVAATSYASEDIATALQIDAAALGMTGGYQVVDIENGETLPLHDDQVIFAIAKHDLREFRITPGA